MGDLQSWLAVTALAVLLGSLAAFVWLIVRGRRLCDRLRLHHFELWKEFEKPNPTLLDSASGTRFNKMLLQGLYEQTGDPALIDEFRRLHRHTNRILATSLVLMVLLAGAIWWSGSG